jgi:Flp pilus assembly protein TadD
MCYNWMGDYDRAIVEAQKALELDPNFPLAYRNFGMAYIQKGMPEKAIAELKEALDRGQKHPRVKGMLGYAYAASGRRAEARNSAIQRRASDSSRNPCRTRPFRSS